jgi:hypothetical protein
MLRRALWITAAGDGDYWLLDPGDSTPGGEWPDGEWPAYTWACSSGGEPERFDSFGAMLTSELASMLRVLGA